ncbi:bifunctional glutamate--cysteine ligase GshA/glutathione synthetase GshB [Streptococcus sp. DD12]|uniref:bifunctional glutamate--cysteine ligase GshA/glutathione synthetase GshB n=1 Tax=Streptococcus sp. DD12 TaxID=1777880 RepID=UPI00079C581F|nr:bifunctional glutamate--cysteine ligase GshA/glutathione synthetase GshB [Streptococcus sp. DD12]KXT75919.1 Glutathione biosynthesis bifunctional protein gshF [Streptococcus sp. DD12]
MNLTNILQQTIDSLPLWEASFGVEREALRIQDDQARIAQTDHPASLGNRSFHPYIQTDFSEAQLELITPVCQSSAETIRYLRALTDVTLRSLAENERLWPLSMPPKLTDADIHVAKLASDFERHYREHLATVYGKRIQSLSGIHVNIGFDHLINHLLAQDSTSDPRTLRNAFYFKLARQFLRYRYLFTYLFGATPLAEDGLYASPLDHPVRSLRSSSYGYVNKDDVHFSYDSLEAFVTSVEEAIAQGQLIAEKECYAPVRFRGCPKNRDYLAKGVAYLEFRTFDIDPLNPLGIDQDTLDSVHALLLGLLFLEESPTDTQTWAEWNEGVALSHPLAELPDRLQLESHKLLASLDSLAQKMSLPQAFSTALDRIKASLADPKRTIGGRYFQKLQDADSQESLALQLANENYEANQARPYGLKGFEGMELSTQMLLFDAIQKGLTVTLLDETDQFVQLSYGKHTELVKNGNMTSKDNYVTPLAMENKVVTKKLLTAQGFPVPAGREFNSPDEAYAYHQQVAQKGIVIKPKSTNYGLGISIFKDGSKPEDYRKACDIAFAEDTSILVETYHPGTEYRFFVLDGETIAVLLRVPANVVGDGKQTIAQLVAQKNANPLRSSGHRSPLETIQLGDIERLTLSQAGLNPDSVPEPGAIVYLRENSNVSTGGDSIDVTDQMHPSYKQLAAQMAQSIDAWVCGVDLIIPEASQAYDGQNAVCLELNFNPMMYMHTYCAKGPGQAITPRILDKLFPELNTH